MHPGTSLDDYRFQGSRARAGRCQRQDSFWVAVAIEVLGRGASNPTARRRQHCNRVRELEA